MRTAAQPADGEARDRDRYLLTLGDAHLARLEETLKTRYVAGVEPLPNDAEIVMEVMRTPSRPEFARRETCIGVRGPDGAIYRHFTTDSHQEFADAIGTLQGLDLVDELADSSEQSNHCDAIFRVK